MFEEPKTLKIEPAKVTPPVAQASETEPEIFVMPRGAPPPKVKRLPPTPAAPAGPAGPVKAGRSKYLVIGGIIFIALLGGAGWWVIQSVKPKVETPVAVAPSPVPETPAVTPPETPAAPTSTPETQAVCSVISSGVDSDSDGLTDVEENTIYRSNPYSPDTDGDKFLDGNEVFHLYSPIAVTPATLMDSGLVQTYQNQNFGYSLWYPASWVAVPKDTETREVDFTAPSGESIIVTVISNSDNKSLQDWYLANIPNAKPDDIKPIDTKAGQSGIQSEDRLTAYFSKDGNIFEIKYNLGSQCTIEFRSTFGMMVRSLVF